MASTIIHIAVAKKILEKYPTKNKRDYYLGSFAPDISKQIGESKIKSHFFINSSPNIPNIDLFIQKYPKFRETSFDLGYFVHLYTDKLWMEYFMPQLSCNNSIKLLDGTIIQTSDEEATQMLYSDYTNVNIKIIEEYDLDLSIFYEDFVIPETNIDDIPVEKLDILINKMGILIENSKEEKQYTFDLFMVNDFIQYATKEILEVLTK